MRTFCIHQYWGNKSGPVTFLWIVWNSFRLAVCGAGIEEACRCDPRHAAPVPPSTDTNPRNRFAGRARNRARPGGGCVPSGGGGGRGFAGSRGSVTRRSRRAKTLVANATGMDPAQVATRLASATHKRLGSRAWNRRFILSSGYAAPSLPIVVFAGLPLTTRAGPGSRVSRSPALRDMSRFSHRGWRQTVQAPWAGQFVPRTGSTSRTSARSRRMRSGSNGGLRRLPRCADAGVRKGASTDLPWRPSRFRSAESGPAVRAARLLVERIGDQDGVVAFGAGGKQRNRGFDQFLDQTDVLHRVGRKVGP